MTELKGQCVNTHWVTAKGINNQPCSLAVMNLHSATYHLHHLYQVPSPSPSASQYALRMGEGDDVLHQASMH